MIFSVEDSIAVHHRIRYLDFVASIGVCVLPATIASIVHSAIPTLFHSTSASTYLPENSLMVSLVIHVFGYFNIPEQPGTKSTMCD